jgi:Fe-S-cluster containining protein
MSASIPPLRESIQLEPASGDQSYAAILSDTTLGQRLRLDDRGLQVARLLDRPQTLSELAERMGAQPANAQNVVQVFTRLHLLDTPESRAFVADAEATRAWQVDNPDAVPLLVRPDAAFTCSMCGGCCGGHNVGPVMADVATGIQEVVDSLEGDIKGKKGLLATLPSALPDGDDNQVICHSRNGSCVFLDGEQKCTLHRRFGADKKPRVCRLFPYEFIATPEGIAVSISSECRGFGKSRHGVPLSEQHEALKDLLSLVPSIRSVRPVLMLDATTPMTYADYLRFEEECHEIVEAGDPSIATLLAMREACERARGQNGAKDQAVDVEALRETLRQFVDDLFQMIAGLRSVFEQDFDDVRVHTAGLDGLEDAVDVLGTRASDLVMPLRESSQQLLFRERVHHFLHGKQLTTSKTVVSGLARLSFHWFLARALMIARARQVKRVHLVDQDVVDAVAMMTFQLRNQAVSNGLNVLEDAIVDLFYEKLPLLVAHAAELSLEDGRLELHKF